MCGQSLKTIFRIFEKPPWECYISKKLSIPSLQRSYMYGREKIILKVLPAFAMKKFGFFRLSYHLSGHQSLAFIRNSHCC
jgi:hypothetical protein